MLLQAFMQSIIWMSWTGMPSTTKQESPEGLSILQNNSFQMGRLSIPIFMRMDGKKDYPLPAVATVKEQAHAVACTWDLECVSSVKTQADAFIVGAQENQSQYWA